MRVSTHETLVQWFETQSSHETRVRISHLKLRNFSKYGDSNVSLRMNETRVQKSQNMKFARFTQFTNVKVALTEQKREDHHICVLLINTRVAFTNQTRVCELRVDC